MNGALCFRKIYFHPTWVYSFRNLRFKAGHERELSFSTLAYNMWVFSIFFKLCPGKEIEMILLGTQSWQLAILYIVIIHKSAYYHFVVSPLERHPYHFHQATVMLTPGRIWKLSLEHIYGRPCIEIKACGCW